MTRTFRSILIYGVIALVMLIVLQQMMGSVAQPEEISYSEFWDRVENGQVESALLMTKSNVVTGQFVDSPGDDPDYRIEYPPEEEDELSARLRGAGVEVDIDGEPAGIWEILLSFLPWLFLIGFMVFIFMQMQGSGNRVMQFGKSRAKQVTKDMPQGHLPGCRRARRIDRRVGRAQRILAEPRQVPGPGSEDSERGSAVRTARYGQDLAGQGRRR